MAGACLFILAPMHRSGTNFLADLLALHQRCGRLADIGEDFVLQEVHHLDRYIDRLLVHWRKHQSAAEHEQTRRELRRRFGALLSDTLKSRAAHPEESTSYLITKTPSVANVELQRAFCPEAKLVIIVRDGRDTVESAIRSFDWSFRHCAHIWRDAAEKIRRYLQTEDGRTALLVRYEDLITNCDHEVRRILDYLELDPAEFDFEAAGQLPVRGSSDLRTEPAGKVHWSPVARSESFNPLSRWHGWSDAAKQQFLWWAGDQLAYFGYLDGSERKPTRLGPRLVGLLRDVRYSLRLGKSITKRIDWLRERTRLRRR